jgi:plasmid stabilization system protein ParE
VTLVFHPLAEREFIAAARFYETRAPGLGADFMQQVERALSEIVAHPKAGRLFAGTTIRRRFIQRFPFGVVYELESANISVIAVMHLRRLPGYWQRRRQ